MKVQKDCAILIGNGINNYARLPYSWKKLLISLTDSEKIIKSINEQQADISYPEFYDLICLENGENDKRYKNLKPKIVSEIIKWTGNEIHNSFTNFCITNNIPILTTNYDKTFLNDALISQNKKFSKAKKKSENYKPQRIKNIPFSDICPWGTYYSNKEISDALNQFAIWNIHGSCYYKRSLVIGASDYSAVISKISNYLYSDKNSLLNTYINWIGRNSWLDIFFHKNLYIIGLSLNVQESSLRWLFIEREKYYRKNPDKRKETFYVYKSGDMSESKKLFFNTLSITLIEMNSYDEIYSSWNI